LVPQPCPPSLYRGLSGDWENEHCGSSAKNLNPVRRVWTPGIVARLGLSMHKTRGVSHCGLAIYIKKDLNAKEELWKLKYFTMQKYNLQKIL
jgi:hypothetical protein